MKILHNLLLVLPLLASSALFASEKESIGSMAVKVESPAKVIQSTITKLNQLTTATTYSPQMMVFLVEQEITPLFDFNHIAAEVLHSSRVTLDAEEAEFFTGALKSNILTTLLSRLAQGRMGALDFVYARPTIYNNITVRLKAKGYSRFGFNLDLSFHRNEMGKWQIFDVALDHDSLVNYYQRMVRSKVRRYGVYGMLGRI